MNGLLRMFSSFWAIGSCLLTVYAADWHVTEDEAKSTPEWMGKPFDRTVKDPELKVAEVPTNMVLFVLAGQSNMAGRGAITPEDALPIDRCLKLGRDGHWLKSTSPIHSDRDNAGYGIANAFVRLYLDEHPGETIGLIPCAVGGSNSATWSPEPQQGIVGVNFWNSVRRARVAGQNGRIAGILWHQGEADEKRCKENGGGYYVARLKAIAEGFRRELDLSDVPFLVGEIGNIPLGHYKVMNPILREAASCINRCACVPAEDLTGHMPDGVHFDTPSYRILGARYYEKWKALSASEQTGGDGLLRR